MSDREPHESLSGMLAIGAPAAEPKRPPPPKALISGFAFLALALIVTGTFYYLRERQQLIENQHHDLDAVTELQSRLLANWISEHEAEAIGSARDLAVTMHELWGEDRDPEQGAALVGRLESLCRTYGYDSAELLDLAGKQLLGFSLHGALATVAVDPAELAPPTGRLARISFDELSPENWRFRISTALRATDRESASGWLVLAMDPRRQVSELLTTWPLGGATTDTLLVRRQGDMVTFLRGLRARPNQEVQSVPVSAAELVEVQAALGQFGFMEAMDSRRQSVLATALPVPNSPWTLIAKIDRREVLAKFESSAVWEALALALIFALSFALALAAHYYERREMAAGLERANRRFLALFDNAEEGVAVFGSDHRILALNAKVRQMLRLGDRPAVGLLVEQVVGGEGFRQQPPRWGEIEQGGGALKVERRLARADGETMVVQSQTLGLPDGRFLSILHDLTETRAAEQREQRAKRLAKLGGWHWDLRTDAVHWDDETMRLLGHDPARDRASREAWLARVHPEDRERVERNLARALSDQTAFDFEHRILLPDGGLRWFRCVGTVDRDESGVPLRVEGVMQDLSEQRQAAAALDSARWQLAESQKTEAIGRLAGGIAHDFNNVVGIILGYGELAALELAPAHPARAHLTEISRAAARAGELTKQLLAFARRQPAAPRVVDLAVLLAESRTLLAPLLGTNIDFELSVPADLGSVRADPAQLTHLVLNLALNARDAMPRGGRLAVTARAIEIDAETAALRPPLVVGAAIELVVEDTGVGMDAQTLRNCFEPFFTTKGPGAGTGLGLPSVKRALDNCGGAIEVDSQPGHGTRFRLWFPAVARSTADNDIAATTEAAGRGERILVVDDLQQMREVAQSALTRAGFRVTIADSGASALARLAESAESFDLLLTDVLMPGLDGRVLAQRALAMQPDLPVLFMTGYADLPPSDVAVELAPDSMIEKPFSGVELASRVRSALDRQASGGSW